jgi:AraC family transcriptional activator of pobA
MKDIPIHQLKDRVTTGFQLKLFTPGEIPADVESLGAHRDDHYLFFIINEGSGSLVIDFNEVVLRENSLYYILPGQVHHRIRNEATRGWFIAVDSALISPNYRNVFEGHLLLQQPYILNDKESKQCNDLLYLLDEKYNEDGDNPFYLPVINSLMKAFLGIVASCFSCPQNQESKVSRTVQLSHQFKKLLPENIREIKSPSAYAAKMNVSASYLNEALKKTTGFSVSYWITEEVILEAKRLLYYSELNVKEIAHALGFDDHAYFSRLFKKSTHITPLSFRAHYRK